MKIIDLLNKIANGEEVPGKIKFNDYEYLYHDKEHGYCRNDYDCIYICLNSEYYLFDILNDEVEILEEEKKIPERLDNRYYDKVNKCYSGFKELKQEELVDKINEIIDYLEKLK